jgi:uncharacterized cupredoxin-like copper-binding protein
MRQLALTVKAGQSVTFVVTNTGAIQHEFYLGGQGAQDEHEKEMRSMGRMAIDEPDGIVLRPGETKEVTTPSRRQVPPSQAATRPATTREA